jgi:2-methylisocitrate lyase-like PEP mutase family enzyme
MTISENLSARFRSLHDGTSVLALPNAWDVASARLVEDAGAAAVATTSAGVAWSLGAPDGDRLGRGGAVDLVARIVAAVDIPVSADIEGGFADDPEGVAQTIRAVRDAGAVGVNIEDADHRGTGVLLPAAEQVERLAAAREAAGDAVFINARVDTYLRGLPDPLTETLARAAEYLAAGADGIFVPGVTDADTVAALVRGIAAPLNVLAGPGAPPVSELARLGVIRVSLGSSVAEAAYAVAARAARELLAEGTYTSLSGALDYATLNALLG